MTVASNCRDALRSFECACRDKTINFETIQHMLDKLFLVNDEVPNEIESLELLDAFADHFSTTCEEEEVRRMVFHLLFPCGFNVNPLREQFLIKLTQLAICVGLTPLLDLIAVWLKVMRVLLQLIYLGANIPCYPITVVFERLSYFGHSTGGGYSIRFQLRTMCFR